METVALASSRLCYRLCEPPYADLDGVGATMVPGRRHAPVFAGASPEALAHAGIGGFRHAKGATSRFPRAWWTTPSWPRTSPTGTRPRAAPASPSGQPGAPRVRPSHCSRRPGRALPSSNRLYSTPPLRFRWPAGLRVPAVVMGCAASAGSLSAPLTLNCRRKEDTSAPQDPRAEIARTRWGGLRSLAPSRQSQSLQFLSSDH